MCSPLRWAAVAGVTALLVAFAPLPVSATAPPQSPVVVDVSTVASSVETTSGIPCTVANFLDSCGSPITMQYGQGIASRLESFTVGSGATRYEPTPPSRSGSDPDVRLLRVDNANIQGIRQLVWMARPATSTDLRNVIGTHLGDRTMAEVLGDPLLNDGTDNLFANGPVGSAAVNLNNIERVSFLTSATTVAEPAASGVVLIERGTGDSARLAAVLSRDSAGEPTSWGPAFSVPANAWSALLPARPSTVLRKTSSDTQWRPTQNIAAQAASGVFVSFAEMGVAAGSTIYGYSLVAGDQTGFVGPWVTTTPDISVGGLDLIAVLPVDSVPPGSVSGTLYSDVDGSRTFTGGDAALAGVGVDLVDADGTAVRRVVSDATGRFEFPGLPPGTLRLRPDPTTVPSTAGALPSAEPDATLDGIASFSITTTQSVVANTNFGFPPAWSVEGRTIDTAALPIAGVTVQLLAAAGAVIQTLTTDLDGVYSFSRVLPGAYRVSQVQPARFATQSQRPGPGSTDDGVNLIGVVVRLEGGSASNDFVEFAPAGIISGAVRTTAGTPIAGVSVELLSSSVRVAAATSSSSGRFSFAGLLGGDYEVRQVQPSAYASSAEQPGSAAASVMGANLFAVTLPPGSTAADNIFVEAEPAGLVSGRVLDTKGNPIPGVAVRLVDTLTALEVDSALSDTAGAFLFSKVAAGGYQLRTVDSAGIIVESARAGSNASSAAGHAVNVTIGIDGQSSGSVFVARIVLGAERDASLVITGSVEPARTGGAALLLLLVGVSLLAVSRVLSGRSRAVRYARE